MRLHLVTQPAKVKFTLASAVPPARLMYTAKHMPDAPRTIISDDGEWVVTLVPRTSPQGWRVHEALIQATDGRVALDLRETDWDCHDARATGNSGFELWLHHPADAARERRLLVWPPGSASLSDFSEATSGQKIRAALAQLAAALTSGPISSSPAPAPTVPDATSRDASPPAPDRFTIATDDYYLGEALIRRCTIVEASPARDHQFTAGTMWNTTLAPSGRGEFRFKIAYHEAPEASFAGFIHAPTQRVLFDGAPEAQPLFRVRDALVQYERFHDLDALRASLSLKPGAPGASAAIPTRFKIESGANEVGPNRWADAPSITDRLTGETLLDLRDTMWDGLPTGDDPAAMLLELRHYPEGGSFVPLTLNLPARAARLVGVSQDISLAWLHRCLNVFHTYQDLDTLRAVLLRGPNPPGTPEVRLVNAAPNCEIQLWPLAGPRAVMHQLTVRITGPHQSTMLDLRSTPWAADIETREDNALVNISLMYAEGERMRGLYLHGCYIDLNDRRLRTYAYPGSIALARLQTILSGPGNRDEAQKELERNLA